MKQSRRIRFTLFFLGFIFAFVACPNPIDTTPPEVPRLLSPMEGTNTGADKSPKFIWTASVDAVSYQLQASTDNIFASVTYDWSSLTGTSFTPSVDMAVASSAPVGTRYFLRIRALDAEGNASAWSNAGALRYVNVGRYDNDFNGDGYADAIVGANQNLSSGTNTGMAYIYFGGSSMDLVADLVLPGPSARANFGNSVASAGDVNGDGYADALVGSSGNDADGIDAGNAYVYFGGSTMNTVADATLHGAAAGDYLGCSVSSAGDANGDGYSDVIVGAYGNDAVGAMAGRAYIYNGGTSMDEVADVTLTGAAAADFFGFNVAPAGDVNGDGYADMIVGAPYNDAGGLDSGRTYLYYGGASMDDVPDLTLTGAAADDQLGRSNASAGDLNGDGYADLIVGVESDDFGGTDAGRAYIYIGGEALSTTPDFYLTGAAAGDRFGNSVASAGDVNGDGYADVIVGAIYNDAGGSGAGRAYIFYGGTAMSASADITLTGEAASDNFGCSVAGAGDVNGDGFADTIVGAFLHDVGVSDVGRAYLFNGGMAMNNVVDITLTGLARDDWFGCNVASAGNGTRGGNIVA